MAIPQTMADLSAVAENNSPAGSDPVGNTLDDFLRAHAAIIRSTNALAASSIGSAPTTNIGAASAESVQITGTTTITSFGTAPAGIRRECRFSDSLTITHSSNIQLPNAEDITTQAGDVITFRSLGSGQWIMTGISRANATLTNVALLDSANTFTGQPQRVSADVPELQMERTSGGSNEKITSWVSDGNGLFRIISRLDDGTGGSVLINAKRSGINWSEFEVTATNILLNGVNTTDYARKTQENIFTGAQQSIQHATAPRLRFNRSGASTNEKRWLFGPAAAGGSSFGGWLENDNEDTFTQWLQVTRNGMTATSITLTASAIDLAVPGFDITHNGQDIYALAGRVTSGGFQIGRVLSTSSNVTLNTGINAGRIGCIYNNSASSITIVQGSGLTLRLAGSTSTGNRTLAPRGFATVWTNSESEYIISGAGLS